MDVWKILNWTILIIAVIEMIWLGIKSSRVCADSDERGFLLAGDGLGVFVASCTIVATGYSGWCFMGAPGVAYAYGGIELLGNFMFAPAIAFATMFFAGALRKRAGTMGSMTIPEYIGERHGDGTESKILTSFAAVVTIILLLVFLTGQIKAVGLLTAQWLDISRETAAVLVMGMIIFYTTLGGLQAVAITDTVMVVGMVIATVFICGQMFADMSLSEMVVRLNEIDPKLLNPLDSTPYGNNKASVFLILPYAFMFAAVLPYMCIRFLAIKKDAKIHSIGLLSAVLAMVLTAITFVGMYMRVNVPGLDPADSAMPEYLARYMHPAATGVITLCILFAMKSTADSILQAISSALSHDLRRAWLSHKNWTPQQVLNINRGAVVFLGVLGLIMTFYAPGKFLNFFGYLGTGTLQAVLIGPVLIGTFWRGNFYGALSSMIIGLLVSSYLLLYTDAGWVVGPITGDVCAVVTYVGVTLMTRGFKPSKVDAVDAA